MTTPPSNQPPPPPIESGPAWLRNPKTSPKKHKSRTPYSANATNAAASSSSSISLLNPQASTSSLTLAQPHQITEPPYLAHKHRYHGQLTLVAPDNSARARQAGTVDPPEMRIDARGGFGLPGMDEEEAGEDEEGEGGGGGQARKIRKKVKKKKKKEEEQQRQRQIMQAVSNAGRTPSPSSNAPAVEGQAAGATPGGPNEMARSSSGQAMLTVPSGNEPRERRSRSRSRNRRTEERTTTTRSPQTLTNYRPTPSTQPSPSDPAPSSRRPRTSRPVPPIPSSSQPVTTHRRSLSPDYMPPPAHESLESQVSLGLLDPSILLSPPPPAYDPPPPISLPLDPPPPISAPSLHQTRRTLSASASTIDSEEDEESDDDGGIADPLVMAWEEDRLTGLYSLDERISRDMERRRLASEALLPTQGESPNPGSPEAIPEEEEEEVPGQEKDDLNEIRQAEASRDNRRLSRALSRHASRRYAAGSRRSTLLMGTPSSGLGTLRETREGAESTSPVPQVTSLSPSPSPSDLPTLIEPTPTLSQPPRPSPDPDTPDRFVLPPLMSAAESSAIAAEFPSPSPSQASPSLSNSPYISDTEDEAIPPLPASPLAQETNDEEVETESEEDEEAETKEQELARRVTRSGREMAVLAAERRARMEREDRERREKGLAVETVVEEEDKEVEKKEKEGEVETQKPKVETESVETIRALPPKTTQNGPDEVPSPQAQIPTSARSVATTTQPSIPVRRRDPTPPDSELSFSQPSSRSSFPRPAAPPQLVPIEPQTTTMSSSIPVPLARSNPPPVPPRRSAGRRSLDEPLPIGVTSTPPLTLHRNTSGRRAPPPPPPPREVAHRSSVRSIAAALNGTQSTPSSPRSNLPPPSSPPIRSAATSLNTTRPASLDSGSVGSASPHPSTLTGPRPVPTSLTAPSVTEHQSLSNSATAPSSLPPDNSGQSASAASLRRHRPLPVPPQPLSQDRIDAFTALRAVQGVLSPTESSPAPPAEPVASSSPSTSTSTSRPILRPRISSSSSSSSLENPGPPLPRRPPQATRPEEQLSAYTDLDLLLARLEGEAANSDEDTSRTTEPGAGGGGEGEDGRNYDDLLTLGEIMGNVAPAGASPEELAEHLTVARVELERRRIDKRGKVKTKLSVVGVRCVDCSVCMSRFKVDDSAVVLSNCLHIFHEKCIRSWFQRSRVCPVCRAQVFPDRPLVDLTSP